MTHLHSPDDEARTVLVRFPELAARQNAWDVEPVSAGLSGAMIWRCQMNNILWALRRWPPEFPRDRLQWIHEILRALPSHLPIPRPLLADQGTSFVECHGHVWSVEPWLPGQADFHRQPTDDRLAAAMRALGEFHNAVRRWASDVRQIPAIVDRMGAIDFHRRQLPRYRESMKQQTEPLAVHCRWILRECELRLDSLRRELHSVSTERAVLVPAIRDIWHDHLLYQQDCVSGVIDFGAMRPDSPATDVSRLVGSLIGDNPGRWQFAIDAYRAVVPFTEDECKWAKTIDSSSVVIAGLNWIRWLFVEHRQFENTALVQRRVQAVLERLVPITELNDAVPN